MGHRRSDQVWFTVPGAVSRERARSLEALMMAVAIFASVIVTNMLV